MSDFLAALGLVFVIEGILFLAVPGATKRALVQMLEMPLNAWRTTGLISALLGLALIWLVRG